MYNNYYLLIINYYILVAIIILSAVIGFVVFMDILKYIFNIDPVQNPDLRELARIIRTTLKFKRNAIQINLTTDSRRKILNHQQLHIPPGFLPAHIIRPQPQGVQETTEKHYSELRNPAFDFAIVLS
ncbi:unnamed protein product [Adineta ricciae]|uniref:Uncharacterized protein n=1 Tax=Adineta ricciae TaxID=249248 RepID=A0A815UL09_ADIRI|nr:unnamed protein product [Adineta ricciae]